MTIKIAYLGPAGTYTENAALNYSHWLAQKRQEETQLSPYPSISQTLHAVADRQCDLGVVPVENSIQGSVAITLDLVWELNSLKIQRALVLPIRHYLLSYGDNIDDITRVYSHPQALAQCQKWLEKHLPQAEPIAMNSTTEAIAQLRAHPHTAAISSQRAAQLYDVPIVAENIQDYPDNATRFWVLGPNLESYGDQLSLGCSVPVNCPGALVELLQVFAQRKINLTRIESRPTKRSLGEYLFFLDLAGDLRSLEMQAAIGELKHHTEVLKIFGNYHILSLQDCPSS